MSPKAIITGGSTGIGRSTAIALARSGRDVAITFAHKVDEARKTADAVEAVGQRCIIEQLDLSSPDTARPCVDKMVDQLGGLEPVVSNAGMMVNEKLPDIDLLTSGKSGFVTGVRWPVAMVDSKRQRRSQRVDRRSVREVSCASSTSGSR